MNEFNLTLPATSANLGPAFDTAALALNLSLRITAARAKEFAIAAKGRDQEICGQLENHLILTTYREVLHAEVKPVVPLSLEIKNDFPIGKGCGSSAAARLAGVALAVHFGNLRWNSTRIIGEAARRERHSDNAAACWMGGVTVSKMLADGEAQVSHFLPKGKWPLLLAIPDGSLSTEKAREVLPRHYSRHDVVSNIQNSMLLLAALFQGDRQLLSSALNDRIHQPYRAPLCPLLPAMQDFPKKKGVLGEVLSGAGPTVLMFLDADIPAEKTVARVANHLKQKGMKAELVLTSIARKGGEASFQK
ncbi:MAG TPA: homoserine kinase [Terriglobales bacterium]|jgi:homoserine kinase|nr:homoserine kinase [Terriglobales bacterium]